MSPRLFIAVALLLGLAFVFVTPPFEVPDEQNHFWRTLAVSRGQLLPKPDLDSTPVVKSTQNFVWVLSRTESRETFAQRLRIAAALPYDRTPGAMVRFAAWYTPLPYVAQSLVAALPLRPMIVFYGGRVANLLVAMILIALAIRAAPDYSGVFAAAALLPMSLYELASLSADAATIALAWLFTALLLVPASPRVGGGAGRFRAGPLQTGRSSSLFVQALRTRTISPEPVPAMVARASARARLLCWSYNFPHA